MTRTLFVAYAISLFLVQSLLAPTSSQARLATPGDLGSVVEKDHTSIEVKKGGQATYVRELLIRINNDQGRESQSVQTLSFNSRSQNFQLIEAETINGAQEKVHRVKVPKTNIEIKEVGELSQAFDSIKQVAISFPDVQVGSKIRMKFRMELREVALKNFWSGGITFAGDFIEDFKMSVRSELPLHFKETDPKDLISVELKKQGMRTILDVKSKGPISTAAVQEELPFTRPDRVPTVWLSSAPDWKNWASEMLGVHERLLKETLPAPMKAIKEVAEKEKDAVTRIEAVAARVAQEFRYFGDWRRRNGGLVPRSLKEIADSRYGDCKDLSLTVAAIYRAMGYEADLAWVYRGELPPAGVAYALPIDTSFNHAVTRVVADGKTYWIDATNPVAFGQGTFPDIAGRPAYVLNAKSPRLETIPASTSEGAIYQSKLTYNVQPDYSLKVDGEITMKGRMAIGITARAFYTPVELLNYELVKSLASNGKVSDSTVGDFPRGSRVVKDLTIPIRFSLSDIGLHTSAGIGFPLFREDVAAKLLTETRDRVSDLYLEVPATSNSVIEIKGARRVGSRSLDCDLKSPFADLKREVTESRQSVRISDDITVKAYFVPVEHLQSDEFAKFQNEVRRCFNRSAVILERR